MADKLTPQQEMAVTSRGGKLLVSAAAGSGKTKVLVDRLLGFLTQTHDPANLDEFLIITYTKAAASELRGKPSGFVFLQILPWKFPLLITNDIRFRPFLSGTWAHS